PYTDHRYLFSFPTRRSSDLFRLSTNEIKNKNIQLKPISIETEIIEEVEEVAVDPNVLIKQAEQKLADANEQAKQLIENAEKQIEDRKSTRLNSSHVKISYAV